MNHALGIMDSIDWFSINIAEAQISALKVNTYILEISVQKTASHCWVHATRPLIRRTKVTHRDESDNPDLGRFT